MLHQATAHRSNRVAVVLNGNARGVQAATVRKLGKLLPREDLFLSQSLEHSRAIARTVLERDYDAVLFGGGDGTFVQCLDDFLREAEAQGTELPPVGVLRLGTGNALADALGCSQPTTSGFVRDLARASHKRQRLINMLTVDGRLTPFAGCGLDAQILEDYASVGDTIDMLSSPLPPSFGAISRYATAVALRTIPRYMASELPNIEVINTGAPALPIDWRTGRILDEAAIPTGGVLFHGPASMASASTIPFYGLKLKMFPFAEARPDRFQLRCCTISAAEIIMNLPAIFRGEYGSENVHDFLCDAVELRMARPVPIQIGGDLQKQKRTSLKIQLSPIPVTVST